MKIRDALNQIWNTPKRHAIIMAPGGAGKSFLVKDLACDSDGPLPIYIDLSAASGEHYIFSEILREYVGNTGNYDDVTAKKALVQLFNTDAAVSPAYRLILDGIDDAEKSINQGLQTEINGLSKYRSLQIVITVRTIDFLKTNYYFDQLKFFSLLSLQLLSEEQRDSVLKDRGLSAEEIAPEFLEILRRPMFLSVFSDLAAGGKTGYDNRLSSARDLFTAIVSRDIDKQASQDGLYDKAEYALHYLLPCLANTLNKVSFTAEELKKALYKSYLDTSYKCGAFDGISTDVILRAKQNYDSAEFSEFRRFIADEIFQKYVAKIFIPRGYIIKTGTTGFRFSHRNWLQYFQMEHLFNLMQRYEEDPSLSYIPAMLTSRFGQNKNTPYSREELSKLLLSAWESETDDTSIAQQNISKRTSGKPVRIILFSAAILALAVVIGIFFFKSHLNAGEIAGNDAEQSEIISERYIDFVLTGGDLTVDDFTEAAEIVYERLNVLADGVDFDYSVENDAIRFSLPESILHGVDPLSVMKSYISRPIDLYLVDLTSYNTNSGYNNIHIPRESIENVEICHGAIQGVNPADFNYEGNEYPYVSITLKSEFMESCSTEIENWGSIVFAQDIVDHSTWYYYETFPQADGRTFLLLNNDFAENLVKTTVYNYSHKPLASALTISYDAPVEWEDPASALRAGEYQVSDTDLSENAFIIEYSTTESDIVSGDWVDTMLRLKKRLDMIRQPYALGTLVRDGRYCVQVKTEQPRLEPYLPEIAYLLTSRKFDETGFMVCGLKSFKSESGYLTSAFNAETVVEDDGAYSLHIHQTPEQDMITYYEYADTVCTKDQNVLLLYMADFPLLTATRDDIADKYEIVFRHLYGSPDELVGENDRWILDLAAEIISGDRLPLELTFREITTNTEDPLDYSDKNSIYASDRRRILNAITAAVPSASVEFQGAGDIVVDLDIYVDEDLYLTGIEQAKTIFEASEFERSRFTNLYIRLISEEFLMGEQANISFTKSHYWGEIMLSSSFRNGRMDKYRDRFYDAINADPFFARFRKFG